MSALKRVASGSAASWLRMGISMASQVALVPLYLSHWGKDTYGLWLASQALLGFFQILDVGHQNFLGNEFYRLGNSDRKATGQVFFSAVPIGAMIGVFELLALILFLHLGSNWFTAENNQKLAPNMFSQVSISLITQTVVYFLCLSVGGIAVRLLAPFGHLPRLMWWGVLADSLAAAAPAVAVISGAGILGAGLAVAITVFIYNLFLLADMRRLMLREQLHPNWPDLRLGFRNFLRSLLLTFKSLLEMFRQQGARVLLAPLSGMGEMAAFATMRTGANTALQGLNTITNPLMPELMRFLNQRDQMRSEAAFGSVWLIVMGIMSPAVVVLQVVAPPLFGWWTRGKIVFDPLLFATFSLGVLVYALAQPAMAVVQGNNLLRPQLIISTLAGGVTVLGMLVLVPRLGIRGAAFALLAAEVISAVGYRKIAGIWLRDNGLLWPAAAFSRVILGIVTAGAGMMAICCLPRLSPVSCLVCLVAQSVCLMAYWRQLPVLARTRVAKLVSERLPLRWAGLLGRVLS